MLLEFSITNYRSFLEKQTFSLLPDKSKKEHPENIGFVSTNWQVLKSAVIYGANASGKSNFLKAIEDFRTFITESINNIPSNPVINIYDPFQFADYSNRQPSEFEINFLLNKIRYRYKFSIVDTIIQVEELYFYPQNREAKLFSRKEQIFEFGDYLKGQKQVIAEMTASNQLYLSKAALNNSAQLLEIYQFFQNRMYVNLLNKDYIQKYHKNRIAAELHTKTAQELYVHNFKKLLQSFDTSVIDIEIAPNLDDDKAYNIFCVHHIYDDNGKAVSKTRLPLSEESTGTQRLFILSSMITKILMAGNIFFMDEFERSLHPNISKFILSIFNNPEINIQNAQLIVATHDTHLLASTDLRRDQIWLIEKDRQGASELYSLADLAGVRNNLPLEQWYLSGRFGAVPNVKELNFKLDYQNEAA